MHALFFMNQLSAARTVPWSAQDLGEYFAQQFTSKIEIPRRRKFAVWSSEGTMLGTKALFFQSFCQNIAPSISLFVSSCASMQGLFCGKIVVFGRSLVDPRGQSSTEDANSSRVLGADRSALSPRTVGGGLLGCSGR